MKIKLYAFRTLWDKMLTHDASDHTEKEWTIHLFKKILNENFMDQLSKLEYEYDRSKKKEGSMERFNKRQYIDEFQFFINEWRFDKNTTLKKQFKALYNAYLTRYDILEM